MDKPSISRKEVFTINCREIPEIIYVKTRFLTLAAAKQKKYENLMYLINKDGRWDLTNNEEHFMAHKGNNTSKPATVTVSLQQAASGVSQPSLTQQTQIPAVAQLPHLPSIRPVPIAKLTNTVLKTNMPNTATLPTLTAIPTITAPQMPVIDMTANNVQATKPAQPITVTCNRTLRDNIQQTEISVYNMKSVGIQCELEEENDGIEINWPTAAEESHENKETDSTEIDKELFVKFVQENSIQYKNSLRECLICGEISKSNKYFFSHMAIHQGTKVLCFKCGFCFHNEDLLRKHNCVKTKLLNKIRLKCPHYRCRVKPISRLELYDHLNEHDNYRPYKCTGCRKAFFTRQEFLRHILIRAKCYTQAKRKRYFISNLENHRDRLCRVRVFTLHTFKKRTILVTVFLSRRAPKHGTCKICMRSIANASVFKSHHIKCVVKFRKRLIRKRYGVKTT